MQCKRSRKFILLNISDHVIPHTHTPHTHTHPALTFNNKDSVGELRSKKQRDEDTGQCTASFYGKTFIGSGIRRFRLNCRVTNVSAGAEDVAMVCAGGALMVWGSNKCGQCSLGHNNPVTSPAVVEGIQNVVQVQ